MSTDSDKPPALTISFRLKDVGERDELMGKAKQSSSNVTDFLRRCIFGNANINSPAGEAASKALIDDITFMFRFFQRNARNLDITGQEKERFGVILKKIKEMASHEP